ncbi:hypothetical protein OIU76_020989 [Salix suchowensis]|nr:hypothetical protein OIU76_020989 [Salix suchowensis]
MSGNSAVVEIMRWRRRWLSQSNEQRGSQDLAQPHQQPATIHEIVTNPNQLKSGVQKLCISSNDLKPNGMINRIPKTNKNKVTGIKGHDRSDCESQGGETIFHERGTTDELVTSWEDMGSPSERSFRGLVSDPSFFPSLSCLRSKRARDYGNLRS